jgi:MbtH protein
VSGPFEDPDGPYVLLAVPDGAVCLWPGWAEVPAGWRIVFGPADRAACTASAAGPSPDR